MTDIRRKRDATADLEVDPTVYSSESVSSLNHSAEEVANVVDKVLPPAEESRVHVISVSTEEPSVSPTHSSSPADGSDSKTQAFATENPELSKTDPSPALPVESTVDSAEQVASTDTETKSPVIDVADDKPSPQAEIKREITAPVQQSSMETSSPVSKSSLKAEFYQPDCEFQHPHSNRRKGTIEIIEELCQRSADGIDSLVHRSRERETAQVRQLEADLASAERKKDGLISERDKLVTDCNDWSKAYKTLQDQLKFSAPYQRIFSHTLPAWMSLEKLSSLLGLPWEDGGELGIDPKIVWRILPAYINLVDELKSDTLAPRQLTSASDTFSEAVCALFDGNDQQVANWHENANEYLKPAGYSFVILAVGAQIDNDFVTGLIQGKTTIETIKRMPLIKEGGDVIRKADVTGI